MQYITETEQLAHPAAQFEQLPGVRPMSNTEKTVLEYLNRPMVGACTAQNLMDGMVPSALQRSSIRRALHHLEAEGYIVNVGGPRIARYAPVAKILRRIAEKR